MRISTQQRFGQRVIAPAATCDNERTRILAVRAFAPLMIAVILLLTACGGGAGSGAQAKTDPPITDTPQQKALPSVSDVLSLVYDNSYQVPDGFYVDLRATTPVSFTMHHVLDESRSYERCTDDFSVAESWEAADNASRAVQGRFVGAVETGRYFEFARELSYSASIGNIEDITSPGFSRVFKCSDTVRDGVDRSVHSGFAGTINARPLDGETVRVFTEYLWQFAFFPTARKKVLDSYGVEGTTTLTHTLLLGFVNSGAGAGGCDRVEVVEWEFTTDRASGETQKRFDVVETYDAKLVGGSPTLCN